MHLKLNTLLRVALDFAAGERVVGRSAGAQQVGSPLAHNLGSETAAEVVLVSHPLLQDRSKHLLSLANRDGEF